MKRLHIVIVTSLLKCKFRKSHMPSLQGLNFVSMVSVVSKIIHGDIRTKIFQYCSALIYWHGELQKWFNEYLQRFIQKKIYLLLLYTLDSNKDINKDEVHKTQVDVISFCISKNQRYHLFNQKNNDTLLLHMIIND